MKKNHSALALASFRLLTPILAKDHSETSGQKQAEMIRLKSPETGWWIFQTGWRHCAAWANTFTNERYFRDLRVIFLDPSSEMWLFLSSFKTITLSTNNCFKTGIFFKKKGLRVHAAGSDCFSNCLDSSGIFRGSRATADLILSSVRTIVILEGFSGQCSLFSETKRNSGAAIYLNLTSFNIRTPTSRVWNDTTLCKKIFLILTYFGVLKQEDSLFQRVLEALWFAFPSQAAVCCCAARADFLSSRIFQREAWDFSRFHCSNFFSHVSGRSTLEKFL